MKNILILLILFLLNVNLFGQSEIKYIETKYLNFNYQECKKKYAGYYAEIYKQKDSIIKKIKNLKTDKLVAVHKHHKKNKNFVYELNYNDKGNILDKGLLINSKKNEEWTCYNINGIISSKVVYKNDTIVKEKYLDSGKLSIEVNYKNGMYHGETKVYDLNEVVKRKVFFEDGLMIGKEDLVPIDSISNNDSFAFAQSEVMPRFCGGEGAMMKYLYENINYPEEAKINGIQGKVRLKFIVNKNGEVIDAITIGTKLGYGCEKEAIRVVESMPRWNPGLKNGIPVNVYYNLPLTYLLF